MAEYMSTGNTKHINFIMRQKTKKLKTKIQYMDSDENVLGEVSGFCTGGSIDISNSDMVRRSINMEFVADSKLEINNKSPFWINKRLKILTGIEDYDKNIYWFNQGIYVPTQPETSVSLSGRTISLSAMDKMCLADNPVLMTILFTEETPVANAIKGLGELYGEKKFMMSNYDYKLPYEYKMAAGDGIQDAIKEITNLYMNYETFYNLNGVLVFDKQKNRINDNVLWDFSGKNDFTISRSISADYMQVYNDFVVYGCYDDKTKLQPKCQLTVGNGLKMYLNNSETPVSTEDMKKYFGTDFSEEKYTNHQFSTSNMGRTHSIVIEEDKYTEEAQCIERAKFELQQTENLINNFSITTAPVYSLNDVNRVIKVSDNGNSYTCLIDSINYPLDISSPMTVGCHEIFI